MRYRGFISRLASHDVGRGNFLPEAPKSGWEGSRVTRWERISKIRRATNQSAVEGARQYGWETFQGLKTRCVALYAFGSEHALESVALLVLLEASLVDCRGEQAALATDRTP